ncbi:unnamed protein product [Lepeophtheirus salmonis]|uniref:(salmon louse) hypothetical protein n=1 Tax=Lepeophtheirus salmonis TaxID=72036 RepID=A0A7R8CX11_LEPSM|nr:unnamed protein product [Lepeophtheirus salmonis]CAF2956620.1 unnamed protein product [Lepeophtheirus salmonis]
MPQVHLRCYSVPFFLSIAFLQSSSAEYEDICGIENKKLSSRIIEYVRPICLSKYSNVGKTFTHENVTSTSWGCIKGSPNPIRVPQLHYVNGLRGVSGGPMNYEIEDGKYMQIGVAGFVGGKTCNDGQAEGFSRVTSFLEWIEGNTGRKIEA